MTKKLLLISMLFITRSLSFADGFSQQMENLNSANLRTTDDLWQRMRNSFQLDHLETQEVKYWEKKYSNPKYFNIIMQNASPYLYFVLTETERLGIPSELALIPIVESTYNPNAVSPAGISTGMWQFISASGTRFGLVQNNIVDERQDVIKSTKAAMSYFMYLHDMFNSWELAIASYNWGEGNIYKATVKANSNDFYSLKVRDITRQYLPKVIALANIINKPSKFGIKLTALDNQPYFVSVLTTASLTKDTVLQSANINTVTFNKLNPQYKSFAYDINTRLLLPTTSLASYLAYNGLSNNYPKPILATINTPNSSNQPQKAEENLAPLLPVTVVADTQAPVRSTTSQPLISPEIGADPILMAANRNEQQPTKSAIEPKQLSDLIDTLAISSSKKSSDDSAKSFSHYTVSKGDTLYSIAKKFNLTIDTVKNDNQLPSNQIHLAQILKIRIQTT